MNRHRRILIGIAGAALGAAGAASAETPAPRFTPYLASGAAAAPALPVKAFAGATRPAPDLADPMDPLAPTRVQTDPMQSAVFAKTAVDRRFSSKSDVTGSLGFLCGLQPGHTATGGDAAYGVDPHGRFVGAKLSFAFR